MKPRDRCLACYEPLDGHAAYHVRCSRVLFGSASPPVLEVKTEDVERLGLEMVNRRLAIIGAQRKLSLSLADTRADVGPPRLTIVGELSGLRLGGLGRLAETTQPHPGLVGVDTIRLIGVEQTTDRLLAVAGIKWNIADTWLVTANVRRPLTVVGLNAGWVPTITFDYAFGQ